MYNQFPNIFCEIKISEKCESFRFNLWKNERGWRLSANSIVGTQILVYGRGNRLHFPTTRWNDFRNCEPLWLRIERVYRDDCRKYLITYRTEFILGNMKIYLHVLSFLNNKRAQASSRKTKGRLIVYMSSYQYTHSHYKDKTVSQPTYLYSEWWW